MYAECPRATVYAFEPIPPIFGLLRRNLANTGLDARVFQCALGATRGEETFVYYPHYTTMSAAHAHADVACDKRFVKSRLLTQAEGLDARVLPYVDKLMSYQFQEQSYRCAVRRLSDVISEHRVERVDMLKIDVQRAEVAVLEGIADVHWPLIHRIAIEVHDEAGTITAGRVAAVSAALEARGFQLSPPSCEVATDSDRRLLFAIR